MTACECSRESKCARAGRHAGVLPAVLLVLLPKCPLCLAAWLSVLGVAGTAPWLAAIWGPALWSALAGAAVLVLALYASQHSDRRPLVAAFAGAVLLVAGKLTSSTALLTAGAGLLLAAYAWSAWKTAPRRVAS